MTVGAAATAAAKRVWEIKVARRRAIARFEGDIEGTRCAWLAQVEADMRLSICPLSDNRLTGWGNGLKKLIGGRGITAFLPLDPISRGG